jgi:hypothetical protein
MSLLNRLRSSFLTIHQEHITEEAALQKHEEAGSSQGCNNRRSSTTWPSLGSIKEPRHQETRSHASDRRCLHVRRFDACWIAPKEQEVESEQPLRTMAYLAGKPKEDKSMPEKADKLEGM